jgi:hypothetical protein
VGIGVGPIEHSGVELGSEVLDLLLRFEVVNAEQDPRKMLLLGVWTKYEGGERRRGCDILVCID